MPNYRIFNQKGRSRRDEFDRIIAPTMRLDETRRILNDAARDITQHREKLESSLKDDEQLLQRKQLLEEYNGKVAALGDANKILDACKVVLKKWEDSLPSNVEEIEQKRKAFQAAILKVAPQLQHTMNDTAIRMQGEINQLKNEAVLLSNKNFEMSQILSQKTGAEELKDLILKTFTPTVPVEVPTIEHEKAINKLDAKIAELTRKLAQEASLREQAKKQAENSSSTAEILDSSVNEWFGKYESKKKDFENLKEQNDKSIVRIEALLKERADALKETSRLEKELSTVRQEYHELSLSTPGQELRISHLQSTVDRFEDERDSLRQKHEDLGREIRELQFNYGKKLGEIEQLEEQKNDRKQEIVSLQLDVDQLKRDKTLAENQRDMVNLQVSSLNEEVSQINGQYIEAMSQCRIAQESSKASNELFKSAQKKFKDAEERLEERISQLEKSLEKLQAAKEEWDQQRIGFVSQVSEFEKKVEGLNQQNAEFEAEVERLKPFEERYQPMSEEVARLQGVESLLEVERKKSADIDQTDAYWNNHWYKIYSTELQEAEEKLEYAGELHDALQQENQSLIDTNNRMVSQELFDAMQSVNKVLLNEKDQMVPRVQFDTLKSEKNNLHRRLLKLEQRLKTPIRETVATGLRSENSTTPSTLSSGVASTPTSSTSGGLASRVSVHQATGPFEDRSIQSVLSYTPTGAPYVFGSSSQNLQQGFGQSRSMPPPGFNPELSPGLVQSRFGPPEIGLSTPTPPPRFGSMSPSGLGQPGPSRFASMSPTGLGQSGPSGIGQALMAPYRRSPSPYTSREQFHAYVSPQEQQQMGLTSPGFAPSGSSGAVPPYQFLVNGLMGSGSLTMAVDPALITKMNQQITSWVSEKKINAKWDV